jgi:signal transduction histidine kinase
MYSNGVDQVNLGLIARLQERLSEFLGIAQARSDTGDLEIAFARVREEVRVEAQVVFRVVLEGHPLALRPLIRNEVYRIGREALINAFRHSGASQVEVNLEYGPKGLRLTVRDNGNGISPEIFRSARSGYRGLAWIRQLADGIGARLKLYSRAAAGTELELLIPSQIAFGLQERIRPSA